MCFSLVIRLSLRSGCCVTVVITTWLIVIDSVCVDVRVAKVAWAVCVVVVEFFLLNSCQ